MYDSLNMFFFFLVAFLIFRQSVREKKNKNREKEMRFINNGLAFCFVLMFNST